MSTPKEALKEHHRRLGRLALELEKLRLSLPPRARLISGLFHALRTGLGASLGYFAARAMGMEQGYWAAITAISVMQASYADVKNSSRDQFVGAMIGGLIGLTAAVFGHDHYLAYLLAVMLGVVLCWLANLGNAGRMSGVTTTIIMLVPHHGAFWQIALLRLGEVVTGAVAALLVTRLLGPLESRLLGPSAPTT